MSSVIPLKSPPEIFECHITCEKPGEGVDLALLKQLATTHGWKTSSIEGDPLLGTQSFFYFTAYHHDLTQMKLKMHEMADRIPVPVVRKKIEAIVYDTKRRLIR